MILGAIAAVIAFAAQDLADLIDRVPDQNFLERNQIWIESPDPLLQQRQSSRPRLPVMPDIQRQDF